MCWNIPGWQLYGSSRFLDFWNRSSTSPLTPNRATRLCIFNSGGFRAVTKYDFDLQQIIFRAVTNMISIQILVWKQWLRWKLLSFKENIIFVTTQTSNRVMHSLVHVYDRWLDFMSLNVDFNLKINCKLCKLSSCSNKSKLSKWVDPTQPRVGLTNLLKLVKVPVIKPFQMDNLNKH